jgi:hypothetical protein
MHREKKNDEEREKGKKEMGKEKNVYPWLGTSFMRRWTF